MLKQTRRLHLSERGASLILVMLIGTIFAALALTLLVMTKTENAIAHSDVDHVKTFHVADAGLQWTLRVLEDSGNPSSRLKGPDGVDGTADDFLPGIRDLSLSSVTALTNANESTASAAVSRDFFGTGTKNYEAFRLPSTDRTRALVYARLDDNFDDDPADPTNNDPLTDADDIVKLTVVSEYPIFVNGSGVQQASVIADRQPAQSAVAVWLESSAQLPAIATNDDLSISGNPRVCGSCGSVHTNRNLSSSGSAKACVSATASGSFSGGTISIGGTQGGGRAQIDIPVVNPFSNVYVPGPEVFDTASDTSLPIELRCPSPRTDPASAKFFALVTDIDKGRVYKAYWDDGNSRWNWKLIDDLDDGTDTKLDPCGRVVEPAVLRDATATAGTGVTDEPGSGGKDDEFYGLKQSSTVSMSGCGSCPSADASMCQLDENDFQRRGHYVAGGGFNSSITLPTFTKDSDPLTADSEPDGSLDFDPTDHFDDGKWDTTSDTVFSPMYGAVVFVKGALTLQANVGSGGYCATGSCAGYSSAGVPDGAWSVSFLAEGYIGTSGNPSFRPARTAAGYPFLLVSARDVEISGNPASGSSSACPNTLDSGSCPGSAPNDRNKFSGIIAAHEQIKINGDPHVMGLILAEDAVTCEDFVTANEISGNPNVFYDCGYPPNPWESSPNVVRWHEIR